jgi:hypothetical protein
VGAIALLFSSAVMLFTLLFGGVAHADQGAETDNVGVGGANTGVNAAAGNGSPSTATSTQNATATGSGDDAVAPSTGSTGNTSTGTADIHTGDANATGNSATNNITQVEGHNGAVVLVDQNATVTNIGVGVANTGGNLALGNVSVNVADATQNATANGTAGDAVAANNATVRNNSGGDARITTGDASATGNSANNIVNQTYDGSFSGLGVVVLLDQNVAVNNIGVGIANTGINGAIGNASQNTATNTQDSTATNTGTLGDAVASNNATSSNNSNGTAGIITGDANAVGNVATNNVSQIANVDAQGSLGSIVLVDQSAAVTNLGISIANTGLNLAVGNLSSSTSNAVQGAVSGAGPPADDVVASNDGTASNDSNGSASIATGDAHAEATGNRSTTNLTQAVDVNTDGNAIVLPDQTADIFNIGIAVANTGGNIALGNASGQLFGQNTATVDQDLNNGNGATVTGAGDDAVASNFGSATTNSNGTASITTGNAGATGNAATTNVTQILDTNAAGGFALPDQEATVVNLGVGIANTGGNAAIGNASTSASDTVQGATADSANDDAVASNFGDATTNSDGSATIVTGNANSVGNDSAATTTIAQTVDTDGVNSNLSDQSATAVDFGFGVSNTGLNLAIGNVSDNAATTTQTATVTAAEGDAVASNFGEAIDPSNGSASITTGNANSIGNASHTTIAQTVNDGSAAGFSLSDQEAASVNIGVGISNTGVNGAIGNASLNGAAVTQTSTIDDAGTGDNVAANFGTASTESNGNATIKTGNANSVGSRSTTALTQTVDFDGTGFSMPDQTAVGVNVGIGVSNTGVNGAAGNISGLLGTGNQAVVDQTATVTNPASPAADIVASNDGTASTESNGSASITTGNANSIGNDAASTLVITQTSDANGAGFVLADQTAAGINVGFGLSNTGVNAAIGNASNSQVQATQTATVTSATGLTADDVVSSNNANSTTNSNGSASINTGAADSVGNKSTTAIAQTSDFNGDGFTLVDQTAIDANIGIAASNTGINLAIGNASNNGEILTQDSTVEATNGSIDADDVVASNSSNTDLTSNGSASITTGAAKSLGNSSKATLAQTSDADLDGGFALTDQTAVEIDLGVGISNTGVNLAVGNASNNAATVDQAADVTASDSMDVEDVVASNSANDVTNSNGSASVNTGWADSTGNMSTTDLGQVADTNITGNGFALNDQVAVGANLGLGVSNTGVNGAIGNASNSQIASNAPQTASVEATNGSITADDVVASNVADASNTSDGNASIVTGAARSIGNDSASTLIITQVADNNISGSGFVLSDQEATGVNAGAGIANTGVNVAAGNVSGFATPNSITVDQTAGVTAGTDLTGDDVVASNVATKSNNSDGSASIKTGDAEGIGNKSTTKVTQVTDADIADSGFMLSDQSADVINAGAGIGNSGINAAIGNGSQNQISGSQDAAVTAAGTVSLEDAVSSNTADLANNSDGRASVVTGSAGGYGNISTTEVSEIADADVDGFVDNDQTMQVFNLGLGLGNSGVNAAIGNVSQNTDPFTLTATVDGGAGLTATDDVVAANAISAANNSDGTASVKTGNATGYGNTSTTVLDGDDALVVNLGLGLSNTGVNLGIGNLSTNDIDSDATALITPTATLGDDAVASNVITESNDSDGNADITTGDAYALGNRSATGIVHSSDAITINFGIGFANTGINFGVGNLSNNTATHTATATAPGGIASNVADLSNNSDGSARIRTGNANAFGNIASNATCQGVEFGPLCPQPPLPPLPPTFPCLPGSSNCPNPQPCVSNCGPIVPPTPQPVPHGNELARTGLNAQAELMLGVLLLAIGALLRRKARTA